MTETIKNTQNFLFGIFALISLTVVYIQFPGTIPSDVYQLLAMVAMVFTGFSWQTCTYQISEAFFSAEISLLFSRRTAPMVFIYTSDIMQICPYHVGSLPSTSRASIVRAFLRARLRRKYVLVLSPQADRARYIIIAPSKQFVEKMNEIIQQKDGP